MNDWKGRDKKTVGHGKKCRATEESEILIG